jgi:ATP-binding cassette subfamily G (WHITE) protein 2 (SNQ2)
VLMLPLCLCFPCSCSTFLKAITNQRGGYLAVNGEVAYGGVSAKEVSKCYAGEVVYNQEVRGHARIVLERRPLIVCIDRTTFTTRR